MKLLEIVDVKRARLSWSSKNFQKTIPPGRSKSGAYGSYRKDPTKINQGVKFSKSVQGSDAYLEYISYLYRNKKLFSNPYFPRIYSLTIEKDEDNKVISSYSAEIEELVHLHSVGIEAIRAIANRIGLQEYVDSINDLRKKDGIDKKDFYKDVEKQSKQTLIDSIIGLMSFLVDNTYWGGLRPPSTPDEQLKDAIKTVKKLVSYGFDPDFHDGNFMVRYAPGGPQLVFTDPIS